VNSCTYGEYEDGKCREYPNEDPRAYINENDSELVILLPEHVGIYKAPFTDMISDDMFNENSVCDDEFFYEDLSDYYLEDIIYKFESKLNEHEIQEVLFLIENIDLSQFLENEAAYDILDMLHLDQAYDFILEKLLLMYRWSLLGKTSIVQDYKIPMDNFYDSSELIPDVSNLLFDEDFITSMNNPETIFEMVSKFTNKLYSKYIISIILYLLSLYSLMIK
jgi:hypothetical protein